MRTSPQGIWGYLAALALVAGAEGVAAGQDWTREGAAAASARPRRDRWFGSGVRRVQATPDDFAAPALPDPNLPGGAVSGTTGIPSGAPAANNFELGQPAANRAFGGGEPTTATEAVEEAEEAEAPDTNILMRALGIEDSPIKFYGWIQNSYTGNTNGKPRNGENFSVFPNHRANEWLGNQYYLVVEKPLEQNDEVNFGFRVDNLFGHDWQFNYMQGFFNRAFRLNQFAGYDIAQFYAEAHLPILTEGGLDVKGGRFYTLAGYEVVPATGRPLLSVPYMFTFGQPFTHTGVLTTLHLTDRINLYNGAINGWDRWVNENYDWGYIGGFSATSESEKTTLTFITVWGPNQFPKQLPADQQIFPTGYVNIPSLAGLPNPGYSSNDRVLFTTVLSHQWSDKLTQVMETDQAWEQNIPGLGSPIVDGVVANGTPKSAQWYSFGNWFLYQFNDKLTGVWRSEIFQDAQGVRTGTLKGDNYSEFTLGMIYKPCPNLWLRPEARYDFAQFGTPFSDGTRDDQFTLAIDAILLY